MHDGFGFVQAKVIVPGEHQVQNTLVSQDEANAVAI